MYSDDHRIDPRSCFSKWLCRLLLFAGVFYAVCFPLTNTDIWWHLAAGKEILNNGFLYADPFSFGTHNAPWTDLHWGFQVLSYLLFQAGGPLLLVLVKCTIVATAVLILEKASGSEQNGLNTAVLLIFVSASYRLVFARPIILTLLFLALFVWVLENYTKYKNRRALLLLPLLQLLWSNVQPLYPLGPFLILAYLFGEGLTLLLNNKPGFEPSLDRRSLRLLGLTLGLTIGACLITPYGLDGLLLPFTLFFRIDPIAKEIFALGVSENIPTTLLRDNSVLVFRGIAVVSFASFLFTWNRLPLGRFIVLAGFLVLALMANRNILLFSFLAGFVLLANLRQLQIRWLGHPLIALLAALPMAWLNFGRMTEEVDLREISPFRVPTLHVPSKLRRIFCSVRYGGYLIWKGYPQQSPLIDGRLVLRSAEQYASYLRLVDQPQGRLDDYLAENEIDAVLLPSTSPDRYQNAIQYLVHHPEWRLTDTDGISVLYTKTGKELDLGSRATVDAIADQLRERYQQTPRVQQEGLLNLGRLLLLVGRTERAAEILAEVDLDHARLLRATCLYLLGRLTPAMHLALPLAATSGPHSGSEIQRDALLLLSLIAIDRKKPSEAIEHLQTVLRNDPENRPAKRLLQKIGGSR